MGNTYVHGTAYTSWSCSSEEYATSSEVHGLREQTNTKDKWINKSTYTFLKFAISIELPVPADLSLELGPESPNVAWKFFFSLEILLALVGSYGVGLTNNTLVSCGIICVVKIILAIKRISLQISILEVVVSWNPEPWNVKLLRLIRLGLGSLGKTLNILTNISIKY
jgi:hypothetical protein